MGLKISAFRGYRRNRLLKFMRFVGQTFYSASDLYRLVRKNFLRPRYSNTTSYFLRRHLIGLFYFVINGDRTRTSLGVAGSILLIVLCHISFYFTENTRGGSLVGENSTLRGRALRFQWSLSPQWGGLCHGETSRQDVRALHSSALFISCYASKIVTEEEARVRAA